MDERDERLLTARGPRAAERLLFRELKTLLPGGRAADLARPVLIVVPSGSLRRQLLRRLTDRLGPALLGLEILSPRTLAARILESLGEAPRGGAEFLDILVRRLAAEEPALARDLDRFDDGYGLCSGSVRDLLSAGLGDLDETEVEKSLADLPPGPALERARAILRVARRSFEQMTELGLERGSDLMHRAAAALAGDPARMPRCSALIIHGFADAPGLTRRFLRRLMQAPGARLILDLPPDPSDATREAPAARFARAFAASLGLEPGETSDQAAEVLSWKDLPAFDAVGREAEVRETAWRIAEEIRDGVAPEDIGLVVRDLQGYAPEIRRQFDEIGLPLSGPALDHGLDPRVEGGEALAALIRRGAALDLDRFALLWGRDFPRDAGPSTRRDLLVACRALGLGRLGALASLDPARATRKNDVVELPVGLGLDGEGDEERARKRTLPGAILREAVTVAKFLLARLEAAPKSASMRDRAAEFAGLARELLGHDGDDDAPGWLRLLDELATTEAGLEIDGVEFGLLWGRALEERFSLPFGGRGLGVQVLGLAQARGLAFERLHVLGLNARVFPSPGREDPLLDDRMREALRRVLPDLGLHRDRPDEESYLFAQLMTAAPRIVLSWLRADDDGKQTARSPFIERLALVGLKSEAKERILEERLGRARERGAALTARDRQILAALHQREGERRAVREVEVAAYLDGLPEGLRADAPPAAAVARAQSAVIGELELPRFAAERLMRPSPWMGRIGPDRLLREAPLWITSLEGVARCPWQAFLNKALRVELMPDPIAVAPDIDALLLGRTVHGALERLIVPTPGPAPRPEAAAIETAIAAAAKSEAREAGYDLAGLIEVLARRAGPMVDRAIELEWRGESGPEVESVESSHALEIMTLRGAPRSIRFRADRVDRGGLGVDYKTGKPGSEAKKAETRRGKLLTAILDGRLLQGATYALKLGRGRYLHLAEGLDDEVAVVEVENDAEVRERFQIATAILETAWSEGVLPPRLEGSDGKEPRSCEYCDFQMACLRGDSGARRRLVDLAGSEAGAGESSILADIWDPVGRGAARLEEGGA